jgi:hypothetical protein
MNSFLTPFKIFFLFKIIFAIAMFFFSFIATAQVDENSEIYKILKFNDSILFERAFHKCEIERLEKVISKNFEFYHDVSGVQNKEEFINAIKNNICSRPETFKRKLVKNTLEVYSLKNKGEIYGAIQKGKHDFYIKVNNSIRKTGTAQFTHLWLLENKNWKLKRVLSFDHKDATE